jgi:hypothetical protein
MHWTAVTVLRSLPLTFLLNDFSDVAVGLQGGWHRNASSRAKKATSRSVGGSGALCDLFFFARVLSFFGAMLFSWARRLRYFAALFASTFSSSFSFSTYSTGFIAAAICLGSPLVFFGDCCAVLAVLRS